MPNKVVALVVASFLVTLLVFSLYSVPAVFARISKGPITCRPLYTLAGNAPHVQCCQTTTLSSGVRSTSCTTCDNTQPPSNCGPSYPGREGSNPTVGPTQSGNGLNSTGAITNGQTGMPGHLGTALPSSGNTTGTLPVNNNTGTLPPGSIIKVPPGTIGSATNPPTNNNTGNPIAMKSTDNPPGCSKKVPIPPNCTLNPFNNSVANKAEQTQQTTGHHVKGSTDASTSTGGNSTGH